MRYYYCPFYFPDAETEIKKLGNLLKVTWLGGGSARLQPSALPPDFVPCKRYMEMRNLLPTVKRAMVSCKQFLTDKCLPLVLRRKSGGIDLVQVVEDMGAQNL